MATGWVLGHMRGHIEPMRLQQRPVFRLARDDFLFKKVSQARLPLQSPITVAEVHGVPRCENGAVP